MKMSRSERLKLYCVGRKKQYVATEELGISPSFLSFLLRHDIDTLVRRIDALPVERKRRAA